MENIKTFEKFSDILNWTTKKIGKKLNLDDIEGFLGDTLIHSDLEYNIVETDSGIDVILDKNGSYSRLKKKIDYKEEVFIKKHRKKPSIEGVQKINDHNYIVDPGFNHLYTISHTNIELTNEILEDILFIIEYIDDEFPLKFKRITSSFTISARHKDDKSGVWGDLSIKICNFINCFINWVNFNMKNKEQTYPAWHDNLEFAYKGDFNSIVISFKRTL